MKPTRLILLLVLCTFMGCHEEKASLPTVDVNANYPERELRIQDVAKVEYVLLETTDSFLTQARISTISPKYIVATNYNNDGNIYLFDRATGKGLKVINRKGQSGEEYTGVTNIVLSESSGELFVSDYSARKILVYDMDGKFKRSFPFADTGYYTYLADYDDECLMAFKGYSPGIEQERSCHVLLSKADGRVVKEIKVPVSQVETVVWMEGEATITPHFTLTTAGALNWGLTRMSSDTIYHFTKDGRLEPALVRTPSIHAMDKQKFLCLTGETDRYYFLYVLEKDFNFETMKGYANRNLIYDKQEQAVFTPVLLNDDYSEKTEMSIGVQGSVQSDRSVLASQIIQASDLIEANGKGILKDNLKKFIPHIDEESNPVVMILSLE